MAKRKRSIPILFMVTEREKSLIESKMRDYGTKNLGSYLRKIAIDGYVVKLDFSDVKELVSLLRRNSNNLNQYTKKAHQTDSIYLQDIQHLIAQHEALWIKANEILTRLSSID